MLLKSSNYFRQILHRKFNIEETLTNTSNAAILLKHVFKRILNFSNPIEPPHNYPFEVSYTRTLNHH